MRATVARLDLGTAITDWPPAVRRRRAASGLCLEKHEKSASKPPETCLHRVFGLREFRVRCEANDLARIEVTLKRDTEAEYVMAQAGQLLGSPAYMSPEQWQDSHAVDRRTDLWAVGVILFELLTGERPFRAERDTKLLMQQILNAEPPPPSQLNSQVPADLDTLCLKCLEKDPSRRFPTAAALAQELHRFLHGEPIHSRPITQWERARKWCQRNPTVASLSAAVVLVLLTVWHQGRGSTLARSQSSMSSIDH